MRISKSMVTSYKFCPYKFYLTYILKIRQPETPAMASGTKMHRVFDEFFDKCYGVSPENWEKLITEDLDDIEQRQAQFFVDQERFRFRELVKEQRERDFYPIEREKRIESKDLDLKGYIDRVDHKVRGKEVTIVEYKTGYGLDLTGLRGELSFYRILWDSERAEEYGKATQFLLINPKRETYLYMKAYDKSLKAMEKQIEKLRCAIDDTDFPRKPFERKCAVCGMCRYVESMDLSNL